MKVEERVCCDRVVLQFLDEIRDELSLVIYIVGFVVKLYQDVDIFVFINVFWGYVVIFYCFFIQQKIVSGDSFGGEEFLVFFWRIVNFDWFGECCIVDDGIWFGSLCIYVSEVEVVMLSFCDVFLSEFGIWFVGFIFREEFRNGEKFGE